MQLCVIKICINSNVSEFFNEMRTILVNQMRSILTKIALWIFKVVLYDDTAHIKQVHLQETFNNSVIV